MNLIENFNKLGKRSYPLLSIILILFGWIAILAFLLSTDTFFSSVFGKITDKSPIYNYNIIGLLSLFGVPLYVLISNQLSKLFLNYFKGEWKILIYIKNILGSALSLFYALFPFSILLGFLTLGASARFFATLHIGKIYSTVILVFVILDSISHIKFLFTNYRKITSDKIPSAIETEPDLTINSGDIFTSTNSNISFNEKIKSSFGLKTLGVLIIGILIVSQFISQFINLNKSINESANKKEIEFKENPFLLIDTNYNCNPNIHKNNCNDLNLWVYRLPETAYIEYKEYFSKDRAQGLVYINNKEILHCYKLSDKVLYSGKGIVGKENIIQWIEEDYAEGYNKDNQFFNIDQVFSSLNKSEKMGVKSSESLADTFFNKKMIFIKNKNKNNEKDIAGEIIQRSWITGEPIQNSQILENKVINCEI